MEQPSIGFDSQGNFYVLDTQLDSNTALSPAGAVTLSKYSFVGNGTPNGTTVNVDMSSNIIDQWVNGPEDLQAVVAVDAGTYPNATATSTPPAGVPQDPNVNKVYIAWGTNDIAPVDPALQVDFAPNRAEMLVSSDGGNSFGSETFPDPAGNYGPQLDSHPQLVINSTASGQVTVVWTDIGTDKGNNNSVLDSSSITPGVSTSSTPTPTSTGIIGSPVSGTDPRGNWATQVSTAGNANKTVTPTAVVASVPVTGKNNDIVVADQFGTSAGGVGYLENNGNLTPAGVVGTFPANATFTGANARAEQRGGGQISLPTPCPRRRRLSPKTRPWQMTIQPGALSLSPATAWGISQAPPVRIRPRRLRPPSPAPPSPLLERRSSP